jgi:hypothetical protein
MKWWASNLAMPLSWRRSPIRLFSLGSLRVVNDRLGLLVCTSKRLYLRCTLRTSGRDSTLQQLTPLRGTGGLDLGLRASSRLPDLIATHSTQLIASHIVVLYIPGLSDYAHSERLATSTRLVTRFISQDQGAFMGRQRISSHRHRES